MPHAARLGSVVVGSRAPRRAAAWYRWALALPGDYERLDVGCADLRFTLRPHIAPMAVEPQRIVTNFLVGDIEAVEARLIAMHTIWIRELERRRWGTIGTVLDADGNYVQIIETHQPDRSGRGSEQESAG